ncbi:MAG: sensor histidine kinase [Acutalibacteraceae bacterium]
MEMFYKIVEWFSVFAEGFIVFAVSCCMCGKRCKNGKHISMLIAFSCIYTLLVTSIGNFTEHMGLVLLVAACYSFAVNFALSSGGILLRCASLTTTWFFLHALDYVLTYGFMFIEEKLNVSVTGHMVLIVALEMIKIIIFCLMWKIYPLFSDLGRKYLGLILAISSGAYALMYGFAGIIMSESVVAVQVTSFFSILFIVVSLIATVFAVTVKTGYEKEKRETELMAMTNSMLEKNFHEVESSHSTIRQQVHDFKNHLLTLRGMLEKDGKAKEYIDELLQVSYEQAQYSLCGNRVIDSIINCKIAEAKRLGINFTHRVLLSSELYISSVDICAVLANQIDNAVEACAKLSDSEEKKIKVEIWQKESFVFFKVTNTCLENPFNSKKELVSTKNDPTGLHGYGVKNIKKTAESYGGTVKSEYVDGVFISVAMIPNNK